MPLHWATGARWSRRQDLHPHWTRSELVASALGYAGGKRKWHSRQEFRLQPPRSKRGALYVELRESNEWRPRMDLHHQPPDPKAGALLFELQGSRKVEAHPGLAPGKSVLQTDGSTALPCAPRSESGETSGIRTRHDGFHRAECCCYIMISIWKVDPAAGAAPA